MFKIYSKIPIISPIRVFHLFTNFYLYYPFKMNDLNNYAFVFYFQKEEQLTEEEYITDRFMGHQSLKAWKIEHDKEVAAQEAKDRKKVKSPKGNKTPVKDKTSDDGKDRSNSKISGKESKSEKSRPKSSKSTSQSPGPKSATPKSKTSPREGSAKRRV